jgi:HNH endonuclease
MSQYISNKLKELVAIRANFRCEYCRLSAVHSYFPYHIEHIISLKHGGLTISLNLAYACPLCNLYKGSDLGTFIDNPTELVRFFNPRTDKWDDHFYAENTGLIIAKTDIGAATIKIFKFNHVDSLIERSEMIRFGSF